VKQAGQCAEAKEQNDPLLADTKQRRLLWKLGVKKAAGDETQRSQVRDQCKQALLTQADKLKEQGCSEPKE
jgi:hypothetical protein